MFKLHPYNGTLRLQDGIEKRSLSILDRNSISQNAEIVNLLLENFYDVYSNDFWFAICGIPASFFMDFSKSDTFVLYDFCSTSISFHEIYTNKQFVIYWNLTETQENEENGIYIKRISAIYYWCMYLQNDHLTYEMILSFLQKCNTVFDFVKHENNNYKEGININDVNTQYLKAISEV